VGGCHRCTRQQRKLDGQVFPQRSVYSSFALSEHDWEEYVKCAWLGFFSLAYRRSVVTVSRGRRAYCTWPRSDCRRHLQRGSMVDSVANNQCGRSRVCVTNMRDSEAENFRTRESHASVVCSLGTRLQASPIGFKLRPQIIS
jgi:hypothetical protein